MPTPDGLVEFLRERLDDDEATAREAVDLEQTHPAPEFAMRYEWARHTRHGATGGRGSMFVPGAPSPARVLADVDAKRRIVEMAYEYSPELDHGDNGEWALEATLRLLALPYAGHPDYDENWRPT